MQILGIPFRTIPRKRIQLGIPFRATKNRNILSECRSEPFRGRETNLEPRTKRGSRESPIAMLVVVSYVKEKRWFCFALCLRNSALKGDCLLLSC
jgi:hypothetical protein